MISSLAHQRLFKTNRKINQEITIPLRRSHVPRISLSEINQRYIPADGDEENQSRRYSVNLLEKFEQKLEDDLVSSHTVPPLPRFKKYWIVPSRRIVSGYREYNICKNLQQTNPHIAFEQVNFEYEEHYYVSDHVDKTGICDSSELDKSHEEYFEGKNKYRWLVVETLQQVYWVINDKILYEYIYQNPRLPIYHKSWRPNREIRCLKDGYYTKYVKNWKSQIHRHHPNKPNRVVNLEIVDYQVRSPNFSEQDYQSVISSLAWCYRRIKKLEREKFQAEANAYWDEENLPKLRKEVRDIFMSPDFNDDKRVFEDEQEREVKRFKKEYTEAV